MEKKFVLTEEEYEMVIKMLKIAIRETNRDNQMNRPAIFNIQELAYLENNLITYPKNIWNKQELIS